MEIAGLQKTTLIDYPGQIACTLFLHGCNFRCGFCYNADIVIDAPSGTFKEEEILNFLNNRKDKLNAICITGGEPLLTLEKTFLKKVKDLGYKIKIDTNGTNPRKLKTFIEEGLVDYIAMDIKGAKDDYNNITGVEVDIEDLEEAIKLIVDFGEYEFRTTVLPKFHTAEKVESIGKWLNELVRKKPKVYYLQGFKNEGNFIEKGYAKEENTSEKFLKGLKKTADKYFEGVEVRW